MADPTVVLRRGEIADGEALGQICFASFSYIAERHGYPSEIESIEMGIGLQTALLSHPHVYGIVAERDGRVAGSIFVDERDSVAAIGPASVDVSLIGAGIGRLLITAASQRVKERGMPGARLAQAAYNSTTLALYTKVGWVIREPLVCVHPNKCRCTTPAPPAVRPAVARDVLACSALATDVQGFDRPIALGEAVAQSKAYVVEREGRVTGYTTGFSYAGHSVAETTDDLIALIAASESFPTPGFLIPSRNTRLLKWCLDADFRVIYPMNLMSLGLYGEPAGAFAPSVTG